MNLVADLFRRVESVFCDLDGTLVEGIPYEDVLKQVATIARVSFEQLMERYIRNWHGLEEAKDHHLLLAHNGGEQEMIRELYRQFVEAKERPKVLPSAAELLLYFSGRYHTMCWTRGESELQRRVLRSSGLESYFEQVIVVKSKTSVTIREHLLPAAGNRRFAIVGDSHEQDIVPLKGLATVRVWISGSRANQHLPKPDVDSDVVVLQSVGDLLSLIR